MNSVDLSIFLKEYWIDCSDWWKNGSKSVDELAKEIEQGDSILIEIGWKIIRRTKVATADILYSDQNGKIWKLKEEKQVMKDGSIRVRSQERSMSEKVRSWIGSKREKILAWILRWVREEINVTLSLRDISYVWKRRERQNGRSYPWLETIYKLFDFKVLLSEKDYRSEGYTEKGENWITTYFTWQEVTPSSPQSSEE